MGRERKGTQEHTSLQNIHSKGTCTCAIADKIIIDPDLIGSIVVILDVYRRGVHVHVDLTCIIQERLYSYFFTT